LRCPGITVENVKKSDLLAKLTDVMSDGVSQDLQLLSIGIDNKPLGPVPAFEEENNWKTEEAMARAVVTPETERIKGSIP